MSKLIHEYESATEKFQLEKQMNESLQTEIHERLFEKQRLIVSLIISRLTALFILPSNIL